MSEVISLHSKLKPRDVILRFVDTIGHKQDAETYLKIFTSQTPESFAIVVLDEEVISQDLNAVIFDLRFLLQLGLFPVILTNSLDSDKKLNDLLSYFEKAKVPLNYILDHLDSDEKKEEIEKAIKDKALPLINISTDLSLSEEVAKVANLLKSKKVIFLSRGGGIVDQNIGSQISIINLRFDLKRFKEENTLSDQAENYIRLSENIISLCHHRIFIAIVSPINLLRELFTVKGAGTLIQKGSEILKFYKWEDVNQERLKKILENSFYKRISSEFLKSQIDAFYIEENYSGAALLKRVDGDKFYISKFAVGTEARGLGVGRDLWAAMERDYSKLFWRSNPNNFITSWYNKQCDGMHKTPSWHVFWKGLLPSELTGAIEYAIQQPIDFLNQPVLESC